MRIPRSSASRRRRRSPIGSSATNFITTALCIFRTRSFLRSASASPRPEPAVQSATPPADPNWVDAYTFFLRLGPLANVNEQYFKNDIAFWNDIVRHPNYDEFWQARNSAPASAKHQARRASPSADGSMPRIFSALCEVYKSIEKQSPGAANTLVMGP